MFGGLGQRGQGYISDFVLSPDGSRADLVNAIRDEVVLLE